MRVTVTLVACVLAACTDQPQTAPVVAVQTRSVAITRPVGDLRVGETSRIQFSLFDYPGTTAIYDQVPLVAGRNRVAYRVADTAIATVSADGLVTARRTGSTSVAVTVDGQFTDSDALEVVRPPQQLVLLASGDGDTDVGLLATCTFRPYGPPGPGRFLPNDCRDTSCPVRGGAMRQPCSIDTSRPGSGFLSNVRIFVRIDTTISLTFLNSTGAVVPLTDGGPLGCPGASFRCLLLNRRVLQPETLTVSVTRRRP